MNTDLFFFHPCASVFIRGGKTESLFEIVEVVADGVLVGAGNLILIKGALGLLLGASAVQLGTAFITCPESAANEGYRAALLGKASERTVITSAISGRPARCIANRFTALGEEAGSAGVPDYPIAYAAAKALNAAAKAAGESGYGAQWAGQGAPLARSLPAATLVAELRSEMEQALSRRGE